MKVSLLQMDIRWGDARWNLSRAEGQIGALPATDLIVLPEMFATGFCASPGKAAEQGGEALEWMKRMAEARDAAVVGSVAVGVDVAGADGGCDVVAGIPGAGQYTGKFYNRLYFVKPDGGYEWYDKRHLFGYGGEGDEYFGGDRRLVVDYRGARIMPLVCYDLRFPVWSRNRGDYDMLLYVANWPQRRIAAWDILLKARAIENLCYAVGVNRVGSDPECGYNGHSAVAGPRGEVIAECREGAEGTVTVELDMNALAEYRERFPALGDADRFEITV